MSLHDYPYQHIKSIMDPIATGAHGAFLRTSRTAYQDVATFDKDALYAVLGRLTNSAAWSLQRVR